MATRPNPTVRRNSNNRQDSFYRIRTNDYPPITRPSLGPRIDTAQSAYAEHGPGIDHKIPQETVKQAAPNLAWPRFRQYFREPLSEFFGVFILVLCGCGSIAQVNLSNNTKGSYISICFGFGLGAMLGIYTAGISGAHINPAVTFTNVVFRKFPLKKFPIYLVAQTLGGFAAALVLYGNYKSAIDVFEGGANIRTVPGYSNTSTAGIFATYPADFMTKTGEFFSEFLASAFLMFCIYMLQDTGNLGAGNLFPLAIFFVFFGIAACFGWETGFAINLARDFGPRLATYCVGYGTEVWSSNGHYFWVPMVAPFCGCLVGAFLYDAFLFTGKSPVNTPWMGLKLLVRGEPRKARLSNV